MADKDVYSRYIHDGVIVHGVCASLLFRAFN